MVVLAVMAGSMVMLSAYTTPIQVAKSEASVKRMNADNWELVRENVPYCDGEKDMCVGYGFVWHNTETEQYAFSKSRTSTKYNISFYSNKEGYNARFWSGSDSKYYYISI